MGIILYLKGHGALCSASTSWRNVDGPGRHCVSVWRKIGLGTWINVMYFAASLRLCVFSFQRKCVFVQELWACFWQMLNFRAFWKCGAGDQNGKGSILTGVNVDLEESKKLKTMIYHYNVVKCQEKVLPKLKLNKRRWFRIFLPAPSSSPPTSPSSFFVFFTVKLEPLWLKYYKKVFGNHIFKCYHQDRVNDCTDKQYL